MEEQNVNVEDAPLAFSYGGQAVIEGVMMRGAYVAAIAVRNPEGEIVVHEQQLNAAIYRGPISRIPFVRGLVGIWDALGLGSRALLWSADVALGEEEDISFTGPVGIGTLLVSLAFGIGLFFLLPVAASGWVEGLLGIEDNAIAANFVEGLIRLLIIVGYIWLIGRIGEVKRLFGYHGAEHKTINAYEAGVPLAPEHTTLQPIEHPRCGTAFLLTVVVVSILVFSFLGTPDLIWRLVSRVLLIPVVAGIGYEFIRFTAKHMDNPLIRLIVIPNLALQHLTTNEPDESMLEVGIVALERVLISEGMLTEEEASNTPIKIAPVEAEGAASAAR